MSENEAKVKLIVCNQAFFSTFECFCPLYCGALLYTAAKYSMNNSDFLSTEYRSGGGVGAYFGHCLTLKEKKGRVQRKT